MALRIVQWTTGNVGKQTVAVLRVREEWGSRWRRQRPSGGRA
jgi:hypothetical protein